MFIPLYYDHGDCQEQQSSVSKATPTRRNLHLRQIYTDNALRGRHMSATTK